MVVGGGTEARDRMIGLSNYISVVYSGVRGRMIGLSN